MILNKGSEISENINICPVGRYVPFTASILQVDKFDIVLFCHSKYVRVWLETKLSSKKNDII